MDFSLLFALGRYIDGQDIVSKNYVTATMAMLALFCTYTFGWFAILAMLSVILAYTMGIGKFNSAYNGISYDFDENVFKIPGIDWALDKLARKSLRWGGVVGMGLRYFIPMLPTIAMTGNWIGVITLLAGFAYWIGGIIDNNGNKGTKGWAMAEFICGGFIGKCL